MTYSHALLDNQLRYNENIIAHYNLDNLEEIVGRMSDERRVYISDLLYDKHYIKLNGVLQSLGLKNKINN